MKSKREIVAGLLDMLGFFDVLNFIFFNKEKVIVLAYHRIFDYNDDDCLFDKELISATCEDFDWQIRYIKKNYNVISLDEFSDIVNNNAKIKKKSVLITFDDGFSDNYYNAFPVLKKHVTPATFFISTDYINQKCLFWFDKVAYIIKATSHCEVCFSWLDEKVSISPDLNGRDELIKQVLSKLKQVDNDDRLVLINEIQEKLGFNDSVETVSSNYPMTWENVIEMNNNGMSFGSHSVTHPILSKVSNSELHDELFDSKAIIEKKLNTHCESLAYPSGKEGTFSLVVQDMAKSMGYKLGFAYMQGVNYRSTMNSFSIKRLCVERYTSKKCFSIQLKAPWFF